MKVSIHFSKSPGLAGVHKEVVLDDLELSTALTLSSALRGLECADIESLIVIREPRVRTGGLPWRRALPSPVDWFNRLMPRFMAAWPRAALPPSPR